MIWLIRSVSSTHYIYKFKLWPFHTPESPIGSCGLAKIHLVGRSQAAMNSDCPAEYGLSFVVNEIVHISWRGKYFGTEALLVSTHLGISAGNILRDLNSTSYNYWVTLYPLKNITVVDKHLEYSFCYPVHITGFGPLRKAHLLKMILLHNPISHIQKVKDLTDMKEWF